MARSKGNPQVLLLKRIIRAFCRFVKAHKAIEYDLWQKRRRYFAFEDEMMGRSRSALPLDVPKGHCAVYVGNERSRFIIPTDYLNHSVFRVLLEKAEEEYGFHHQMGLTIPCDEVAFQSLTSLLQKNDAALGSFRCR